MRSLRAALGDGDVVLDVRMLEMSLYIGEHTSVTKIILAFRWLDEQPLILLGLKRMVYGM